MSAFWVAGWAVESQNQDFPKDKTSADQSLSSAQGASIRPESQMERVMQIDKARHRSNGTIDMDHSYRQQALVSPAQTSPRFFKRRGPIPMAKEQKTATELEDMFEEKINRATRLRHHSRDVDGVVLRTHPDDKFGWRVQVIAAPKSIGKFQVAADRIARSSYDLKK
jgi:hypothetical protein